MKKFTLIIAAVALIATACVTKKDNSRVASNGNGQKKGWTKNPNNPHNPNTTNPGHTKPGTPASTGKSTSTGNSGKSTGKPEKK